LNEVFGFFVPTTKYEDYEIISTLVEPILALEIEHHGHQGSNETHQRVHFAQWDVDQNEENDGTVGLYLSHYFGVLILVNFCEVVALFDQEDIKLIMHVFEVFTYYEVGWVEFGHSFFYEVHPWY